MFRHLERGGGERFAVGGGPASANALRLARRNNQNRAYQIPSELSHDPPLFDRNYRWPFRKTSDPRRAAIVKCASISPLFWTPSMDQKIMCATRD
jgi:hypothetical protein